MKKVYLSLGSNLDHPMQQLETAIHALSHLPTTDLKAVSQCYITTPIGFSDQGDFYNMVCSLETALSAERLLEEILSIEQAHHRIRNAEKNGPRTLDIDILLYEDVCIRQKNLEIPHPRLTQRAFVVIPLLEIAPQLVLSDGRTLHEIANSEMIKKQMKSWKKNSYKRIFPITK